MTTVDQDRFFHLRGHHVQGAHGRRSELAADGSHLGGGMIALLPSEADARRLALRGGESAGELHLTLYFLGEDGTVFSPDDREALVHAVSHSVEGYGPVTARAFGANHWNGDGENPCWVLGVGDMHPDVTPPVADTIMSVRRAVTSALDETPHPDIPDQHAPWAPHVCLAYTDDLSLAKKVQSRLGEITFDRVRLAFAGEHTDIPLTGSGMSASAGSSSLLRRNLSRAEKAARIDFARMDRDWKTAVSGALDDLSGPLADVRSSLVSQVRSVAGTGDPEKLNGLSVSQDEYDKIASALVPHLDKALKDAADEQYREAREQGVPAFDWSASPDHSLTAASGRDLVRQVARVTSRLLGGSLVYSAVRKGLALVGRKAVTADQAAREVSDHLDSLSDAGPREAVAGAVTSAQNEGRRTVLAAAPPAKYYSAEILDSNVCSPCRHVDGTEYDTLEAAMKEYPSGGFKDCLGGQRCRGTYLAVWYGLEGPPGKRAT